MTTRHTPGPWNVSQNVTRHVIGPEGGVVACAELTWTNEITEANARLIAAAPNLLKALTDLIANQDATWVAAGFTHEQIKAMPYLKPAREAIAKATGGAA